MNTLLEEIMEKDAKRARPLVAMFAISRMANLIAMLEDTPHPWCHNMGRTIDIVNPGYLAALFETAFLTVVPKPAAYYLRSRKRRRHWGRQLNKAHLRKMITAPSLQLPPLLEPPEEEIIIHRLPPRLKPEHLKAFETVFPGPL